MGTRSRNYIALKRGIDLSPLLAKYGSIPQEIAHDQGTLLVYETNISPMWARPANENCTYDLEEDAAIHRFVGSLSLDSFYMKRAGAECGVRGNWSNHPFSSIPLVHAIDFAYSEINKGSA